MSASDGALEQQVRRVRAAIMDRHGVEAGTAIVGETATGAVDRAASLAKVNAHWGIASKLPVVGTVVVLVRRVMRIALRWYINPIVEQQNAFNEAAVAALYELQLDNERLRSELVARSAEERPEQP